MKITSILGLFYLAKLSFKIDGTIKVFHDKQKLKQYMTNKPLLQKILQGILHTENESKQTMKGQAIPNHRRRKGKKVQHNTDSATHNQTFKQHRQLHDRDHHVLINTNMEC
jgi:hypothetical protein